MNVLICFLQPVDEDEKSTELELSGVEQGIDLSHVVPEK